MADSLKDAVRADAFRKLEVQDELADPFATPERNRQHADSFFSDEDEGPNDPERLGQTRKKLFAWTRTSQDGKELGR